MAISAAVGYDLPPMICAELDRSEHLRAPVWARPGGSFSRAFRRAEALYFAGAALAALDSVVQIRPALGRRLASPSRPEKRRRGGGRTCSIGARTRRRCATRSPSPNPGRSSGRRDGSTLRSGRFAVRATLFAPSGSPLVAADLQSPLDLERAAELAAACAGRLGAPRDGRPRSRRPRPQ